MVWEEKDKGKLQDQVPYHTLGKCSQGNIDERVWMHEDVRK